MGRWYWLYCWHRCLVLGVCILTRAYPAVRREVAFVTLFNVSLLPTMICCWGLAVVYRLTLPVHPLLTIFVGSFFCVLRTGAEEMCERLLHRVPTAGNSRFALVDIMIVTNHITYLATILGASPEYVTSSIAFIDALSLASLVPYITGQTRVPVSDWLRWKLSGHKTERWGIGFSLRSAAQTRIRPDTRTYACLQPLIHCCCTCDRLCHSSAPII